MEKTNYKKVYRSMKFRYIPAFIIIILLIITRQVIIDYQIDQTKDTSRIINIAGKQRMLSQMITKDAFIISHSDKEETTVFYLEQLKNATVEWKQASIDLQDMKNSPEITELFSEIQNSHDIVLASGNVIIEMFENGEVSHDALIDEINIIEKNEIVFLDGMEYIVDQYDKEGKEEIEFIEKIEMALFWVIILVILFVVFFIFIPSERALNKAFFEISEISESMKKLFKTGQNILFLVNEDTFKIIMMSEESEKLLNIDFSINNDINLSEALNFTTIDKESFVYRLRSEGKITQMEIGIMKNQEEILSFLLSSTKVKYLGEKAILITLFDITVQKNTEAVMRNISIRDKLTGLYNRHFLDEIINEEMERALRYNFQISVSILDLDFFKRINDTWGHPVGDIILKETADLASENLRRSDFLIRIGGEEFLFLMPHTNLKEAMIVADKIRREIEKIDHSIVGNYTASFGVAQWDKAESFKELYERADEALYKAKDKGRNRVISSKKRLHLQTAPLHLEWKKEWDSGNEIIDKQHKELLEIANDFVFLSLPKSAPMEPMEKIDDLIKHVIHHFECEEGILKESNYLGYLEHSIIHEKVKEDIEALKSSYSRGEVKLSAFFTFMLDEVLIGHMLDEDTKFFPVIKKTKK